MNATISPVPATAEGIACANCSGWVNGRKVQVRHANRDAVRACSKLVADRKASTASTVDRAAQAIADAQAHLDAHPELTTVRITELPPVPVRTVPVGGSWAGTSEPVAPAHPAPELGNRNNWGYVSDGTPDPEKVVPAGRYAIKGTDGQFRFYVIDHGRKGTKWEGRVFVSVQASDELHPVRNRDQRIGILAAIMTVGPLEASKAYGRELGICGVCRRTLTDPESIANGIGPVCAGKL